MNGPGEQVLHRPHPNIVPKSMLPPSIELDQYSTDNCKESTARLRTFIPQCNSATKEYNAVEKQVGTYKKKCLFLEGQFNCTEENIISTTGDFGLFNRQFDTELFDTSIRNNRLTPALSTNSLTSENRNVGSSSCDAQYSWIYEISNYILKILLYHTQEVNIVTALNYTSFGHLARKIHTIIYSSSNIIWFIVNNIPTPCTNAEFRNNQQNSSLCSKVKSVKENKFCIPLFAQNISKTNRTLVNFILSILTVCVVINATEAANAEYTPVISTRYGQLRGVYRNVPGAGRVGTYLGIPYATPPIAGNRLSPTRAPSQWRSVLEAIILPPACPQNPPKKYSGLLRRQSEDCLYLNLYVPGEVSDKNEDAK